MIEAPNFYKIKSTVPEGQVGNVKIDKFSLTHDDLGTLHARLRGMDPGEGDFTRLVVDGGLMMSDTQWEVRTHGPLWTALRALHRTNTETGDNARVLLHGLGMGLTVEACLITAGVTQIDVVEINGDVIELVGPWATELAVTRGVVLNIYHADARTHKWESGQHWDIAWHDIWPNICEDNRDEMNWFSRSFGRRTSWQGCWSRPELDLEKNRRYGGLGW